MMISTRGRYALRVMIDLALHADSGPVPMKEVASRQEISFKYLERIMPVLSHGGLVKATAGRGGGYRLAKAPEECRVGDVLRLTEGSLAPVACLGTSLDNCRRASDCPTLTLWQKFTQVANDFFDSITIADLLNNSLEGSKHQAGEPEA